MAIYNIQKHKIKSLADCFTCEYYDKKEKKCLGLNKICYEYDRQTETIIDGITKLPLKNINKEN